MGDALPLGDRFGAPENTRIVIDASEKLLEMERLRYQALEQSKGIIEQYDLESAHNSLSEFPDKLFKKRSEISALARQWRMAQEAVKLAEARLQIKIAVDIDERTGKPRFSNEASRQAELTVRKNSDPDYQAVMDECGKIEMALDNAKLELQKLIDEEALIKGLLDYSTAEIKLLAR